jgi:hypothetical protein
MNSSTSSSDEVDRWRGFFWRLIAAASAIGVLTYGFIVVIDPFNVLAFSPPLERVPVATNARFAHPALARNSRFDSAVFGTSTSRLLRPVVLDSLFHARFANLAMNDAQAYEQYRLLELFTRYHQTPLIVMIGLDAKWCATGKAFVKYTPRPISRMDV